MTQDNQHAEPEKDPGGYGTPTAEQEMAGSDQHQGGAATNEPQADGGTPVERDVDLPSASAEIDENNDDSTGFLARVLGAGTGSRRRPGRQRQRPSEGRIPQGR